MNNQQKYHNYHRHDHQSNIRTLDCVVKPQDYINRALELNHNTLFTTQHGWTGNFLETYDLCQKNNIKMIYGAELYIVKDRFEKDNSNSHIIIIGKNQDAFYELNTIMSESNKTGFYYKPRIDLSLLLSLNPQNFIITSACVAGVLRSKENSEIFLEPILKHFGKNFYLEVQAHPHPRQYEHNKYMLELSSQYNVELIHANDSHYIYPEQSKDRDKFLSGKGMKYDEEAGFILDYPNYETIVQRYKEQNLLLEQEIIECINNTMIFDECEDLYFDKEVKMPSIYPNENPNEILKKHIVQKWNIEKNKIDQKRTKEYQDGIKFEFDIIEKTNMADYFLLNEKIIDVAVNKYGGILTRTGRGSAVSFYINKLLGFTEIDRFESEVPLYPTRFMSVARILESKSLPDIDFNWADVEAPIKASKEILGEDNIYYMYAMGTMQESAAFRNLCRCYNLSMDEYNEVGKDLDKYRNDPKWKDIIEESQKFIGVIDSIAPSPCSFVMLDKPISKHLGLIKVGQEMCACIDGYTADVWKYLKNDFLTVRVWKIISDTFKLLKKPIPEIRELKKLLDKKAWDLYSKGYTATLNQVDTDISTSMVKRYKPVSVAQLSGFVAAIRPGFASLVDTFLERREYTNGVVAIDELLKPSYNFMLYQESIMAFLVWCGLKEDHTYDIIKKIAKKKFKEAELIELKEELLSGYVANVGNDEGFNNVWQIVEDAASYSFNAAHALSVAWDSLYGAYLKANYPLEYFSVVLNEYSNDSEKTKSITEELPHFNIKVKNILFGKSTDAYTFDKEKNIIYKSITSIKYCNAKIAQELFELSQNNSYEHWIDLLADINNKTSVDSRQLRILTGLNFFSMFGKNKKLLEGIKLYDSFANRKQITLKQIAELNIDVDLLKKFSGKITDKMFKDIDMIGFVKELYKDIEDKPMSVKEQCEFELLYLSYIVYLNPKAPETYYFVSEFKTYKDQTKPYVTLYNISSGDVIKTKIKTSQVFIENPFQLFSILKIKEFGTQKKTRCVNGVWKKTDEDELILTEYEVY